MSPFILVHLNLIVLSACLLSTSDYLLFLLTWDIQQHTWTIFWVLEQECIRWQWWIALEYIHRCFHFLLVTIVCIKCGVAHKLRIMILNTNVIIQLFSFHLNLQHKLFWCTKFRDHFFSFTVVFEVSLFSKINSE